MNKLYRVTEIFSSIQGEGFWTGTPVVFVRFSGCNLSCPWCDTDHKPRAEYDLTAIADEVVRVAGQIQRVVLTGGEPLLQADDLLIKELWDREFLVHVETNGTQPLLAVNWVCVSPKAPGLKLEWHRVDEVKIVLSKPWSETTLEAIAQEVEEGVELYLQPCWVPDPDERAQNVAQTVQYVKDHPWWRLGLQIHRLIGVR